MGWASPDKWAKLSPRKKVGQYRPKMIAPILAQYIFSSLFRWSGPGPYVWAGPNQVRPTPKVNCFCRNVNNYCSHSASNQMVTEVADGWRRRLQGVVVTTVMQPYYSIVSPTFN